MFTADFFIRPLATPLFAGLLLAAPATPLRSTSPAPVPSAVSVAGDYGGAIDQVWSEFDVWSYGDKGMIVHVRFHTSGLRGVFCRASAYFAYEGGEPLNDYDGSYSTVDGKVAASANFTPIYENSDFNDLRIFIPYSQLHMASGRFDLEYHVELYTVGYQTRFAYSRAMTFEYTRS